MPQVKESDTLAKDIAGYLVMKKMVHSVIMHIDDFKTYESCSNARRDYLYKIDIEAIAMLNQIDKELQDVGYRLTIERTSDWKDGLKAEG